jgi:hypothetical protein
MTDAVIETRNLTREFSRDSFRVVALRAWKCRKGSSSP